MRKELKRYSSIGNRAGILLLCRKVLTGNIEDLSSIGASCSFINGIDLNFKCGIIAFEEIKLISIVDNKCQAKDILYSHEDEEYGSMRAIGMSNRQLIKMIIAEAGTYAISGVIWGCIIGLPMHWVIYVSLITNIWGTAWSVPFIEICL